LQSALGGSGVPFPSSPYDAAPAEIDPIHKRPGVTVNPFNPATANVVTAIRSASSSIATRRPRRTPHQPDRPPHHHHTITAQYAQEARALAEKRIVLAGWRLGKVLNRVFGKP
jgi:hypothetical protein